MRKRVYTLKASKRILSIHLNHTEGSFFNLFTSIAQLERDIIIESTRAGIESSRRRGVRLGRQPGLSKKAQHKAILAEKYYRDNKLTIEEIMKLIEVGSKRTLYKYLAHQSRRTCKECGKLFWDKNQNLVDAYCNKHMKAKEK